MSGGRAAAMRTLIAVAAILTIVPLLIAGTLPLPHGPLSAAGHAGRLVLLVESVGL